MKEIFYRSRPFKVRNADEYDLSTVLDLFVDPTESLYNPFDYENVIVKGRMGTGKTMYLRANHAFYLYSILPAMLTESPIILPIYIRLSDFQHLTSSQEIYKAIIIRIIEEMTSVYKHLKDANKMANIHKGMINLLFQVSSIDSKLHETYKELMKLSSEEYYQRIKSDIDLKGGIGNCFINVAAQLQEQSELEIKNKATPSISDIDRIFSRLLGNHNGKILLLIDEAGSLNKTFFYEKEGSSSFEILMNQLRTLNYIRTKIAIYPQTYSDILTETRYGDTYYLQEDITSEKGYESFKHKAIVLIERYLSAAVDEDCSFEDLFERKEIEELGTDALEQLINASAGNMRRFVQLLDQAMNCSYEENKGKGKVNYFNAIDALIRHGKSMEDLFNDLDKEFLSTLVKACKSRQAYKFKFPNKAALLYKFTYKSSEANILNIVELGTGRRSTTYSFDYAYCIYTGLATHFLKGTERIDKLRSRINGEWIERITTLSDELLDHASLPGKIEGIVNWVKDHKGFIKGDDGEEYFWDASFIIESDRDKRIIHGKTVRFYPISLNDSKFAMDVEVL